MYRELILQLAQEHRWVKIQPPCLEEEINATEDAVGHPFPRELKELLQELNGDNWCLLSAQQRWQKAKMLNCYKKQSSILAAYINYSLYIEVCPLVPKGISLDLL